MDWTSPLLCVDWTGPLLGVDWTSLLLYYVWTELVLYYVWTDLVLYYVWTELVLYYVWTDLVLYYVWSELVLYYVWIELVLYYVWSELVLYCVWTELVPLLCMDWTQHHTLWLIVHLTQQLFEWDSHYTLQKKKRLWFTKVLPVCYSWPIFTVVFVTTVSREFRAIRPRVLCGCVLSCHLTSKISVQWRKQQRAKVKRIATCHSAFVDWSFCLKKNKEKETEQTPKRSFKIDTQRS